MTHNDIDFGNRDGIKLQRPKNSCNANKNENSL